MTVLCMHGVNNIVTSMAPMYLRDKVNSGMTAGVLNGFCYVGSTISSYGLGAVADSRGWSGVIGLLFAVCAFFAAVAALSFVGTAIYSRRKRK